jgi:hypothetical protein
MVSVLTVSVKISAIRGVPVLTATALAMILGWLGVQVLLILFHYREMSRTEMASSVKTARIQNVILKFWSPLFLGLFMALHLPFFAYGSYQITWKLSLMALIDILMRFATAGMLGVVAAGMLAHIVHLLLRIFIRIASRTPWSLDYTYAGMVAPCVVIFIVLTFTHWPLGSVFSLYPSPEEDIILSNLSTNSTSITLFDTLILVDVPIILHIILVAFTFYAITAGFWHLSNLQWSNANVQRLGINVQHFGMTVSNTIFCIALSVWYLFLYSAEGTYKPLWTEWLG